MLAHKVIRPRKGGMFLVVYPTPGCASVTVACECRTKEQAIQEAANLNDEQVRREKAIRWDRELRGLDGVYPALEAQ